MLGRRRRLALLTEGRFTPLDAKTAVGILRYRVDQVAAVIDSTRAGRTALECVGVGGEVPVVAGVEAAARAGADSLLIGIAPQGGELPAAWRGVVREALERGWDVLAGLHAFLADDPEFRSLAASSGAQLIDARRPPQAIPLAAGRAAALDALVVLTVGTDCNVGKMTAALELESALKSGGTRAAFVATGQTGIFIADRGVAVDAVPSDFAAGAVEALVVEAARDADVVVVEGQGALHHPAYSGVALSLLHGAAPEAMILCHEAGRERLRYEVVPAIARDLPPLATICHDLERAASWIRPARVVGLALNTSALPEPRARAACAAAERELSLPATDPVRFGAAPLADAVRRVRESRAAAGATGAGFARRGGASRIRVGGANAPRA